MLVVNEPELVEALNRLRGEWAERSGGELKATGTTWKKLSAAKEIDADLVLFPSRYLGEFCVRDWLRPVRASVLESEALNAVDFFPLVRNELIRWGGNVMALPLGIDPSAGDAPVKPPSAMSLLAIATPGAITNERLGILFDAETMKPRIADSVFVESLFLLDRFPFDQKSERRKPALTDPPGVPVLGYNDRLIGVTAASRNAASAFKLLEWLASGEVSSQLARNAPGQLPVRRSLASAAAWHDPALSANDRTERGKILSAAMSNEKSLLIPRIPGIDEYLGVLEEAVKSTTDKKAPPAAALAEAAAEWEKITEAHGRDAQRDAYQKHLGISDK